jgi:hypothetical protein
MGFSQRWIDWISIIFSSASTRILLNSTSGGRIYHAKRLHQGDPLSPLLFVLAMDVLNAHFKHAEEAQLFIPLLPRIMRYQVLLYADDLVIFIAPLLQDAKAVRAILEIFTVLSRLCTIIAKCSLSPICCSEEDADCVQQAFPCQVTPFPCKNLGVPLSVYKLKEDLQPLVDSVTNHEPSWKTRLMSCAGRTMLTKVTQSPLMSPRGG